MKDELLVLHDSWNAGGGPRYPHEKVVQFCFRNFKSEENQSPYRALDLGCGGGVHTKFLAEIGFDVTAVDFSPNAVRHTTELLKAHGLQAEVQRQTAEHLALPDAEFDLILCIETLQCLDPDQAEQTVASVERLLCKGGLGMFLFTAEGDTVHRESPLRLRAYREPEVRRLFSRFPDVWLDTYLTTYRNGEATQREWLVTTFG